MRGPLLLFAGLTAFLFAGAALPVSAQTDPALTKDQLIKIFTHGKKTTRGVTFKDDDNEVSQTASALGRSPRADLSVNFDIDSANLTPAAKAHLSEFAAAAKDPALKGKKFEIAGYTDATGPESYNLTLSERRAQSVVGYLTSLGVDAKTLAAKGYGKNNPREADPFNPKNRRVEGILVE